MPEHLLKIGDTWWALIETLLSKSTTTNDSRMWKVMLRFRGFRLTIGYTEKDHPDLFPGKGMDGIKDPGYVVEIYPPNRVMFSEAGILTVWMLAYQVSDEPPLSAEDIRVVGRIFDELRVPEKVNSKAKRKSKDTRPLPDKSTKTEYDSKIRELLATVSSNREIARRVINWAEERGQKVSAFNRFRVYGNSSLEKMAGKSRKAWSNNLNYRPKKKN